MSSPAQKPSTPGSQPREVMPVSVLTESELGMLKRLLRKYVGFDGEKPT